MQTTKNTILITGGSSGIGLAMAETFTRAGNEVIVCGRDEKKLLDANRKIPGLKTKVCDVSKHLEREELFRWVIREFPQTNILINNAGIQKEIDFLTGATGFYEEESEIETNLTSIIHLTALFVPHFLQQKTDCAIANITSGLAFIPLKIIPVYCATKAAVHSFSISLRSQLAKTNVRVFEVAPPIVKTELHRKQQARKMSQQGLSPTVVAEAVIKGFEKNQFEIVVGRAKTLQLAAQIAPAFFHKLLNRVAAG